ncbi:MAG: hypothetical protein QOF57_2457 [Frankiaceae bacterium]|nr:hypothetical protein [Frankiaceae bacterium]
MRVWRVAVPLVAASAGLLFTTSAVASHGVDLRNDRVRVTDLIGREQASAAQAERQYAALRAQMDAEAATAAAGDARVKAAADAAAALAPAAGLTAVHGPGLVVSLDDAPLKPGRPLPRGAGPNDVVVHQQDVQAVVNALWAGGAEALTIMGERVVSTSAVRCVGNTLLLHGRVYAPPFVIGAIGDPDQLLKSIAAEPDVQIFQEYVAAYGLGFTTKTQRDLTMPAYTQPLGLTHAGAAS